MAAKLLKSCVNCNTGDTKNKTVFIPSKSPDSGPALDKLAQLQKFDESDLDFDVESYTDIADKKPLLKRARRKYFTDYFSIGLVNASKNNPYSILQKSYWNSYHCAKVLHVISDGTVRGKYCKNRWCLVCNSISTARLINKYTPVLNSWENKYMVTLTVPNCKGLELKGTIGMMYYYFVRCKDVFYKRKSGFRGLRKLECTYNARTNEFHPHFHIVVDGKCNAYQLVEEWLKRLYYAKRVAQDVRSIDDGGVMEMFKYFSKVISDTGKPKKSEGSAPKRGKSFVYADAQDYIFNAVRGRRVFQPFGFKISDIVEEDDKSALQSSDDVDLADVLAIAEWDKDFHDWFRTDTGEGISGYVPGDGFKKLVTERIVVRPNYLEN